MMQKNVAILNSTQSGHSLTTPVPFVQPVADNIIRDSGGTQTFTELIKTIRYVPIHV